jgi:tetratricopeptide (TPR) repeat protein
MFQRFSFRAVLLAMVLTAFAAVSFSQTAPVSGTVKLKKADGTLVPAAGVTVDAYRIDIDKGKMPSGKTNKRGEFSFVGFTLGQTYALVVSGPGIAPDYKTGVKAGTENINFEVREGDGKTWTEEEFRAALKSSPPQGGGEMTAEQKKAQAQAQADYEKKVAEVKAKNEKIQAADEIARKSSEEGNAALKAGNYDVAIQKYDEGVAAVPDYIGSTPILLDGKLVALKGRGYGFYKEGVSSADPSVKLAKFDLARKDFTAALGAYAQAIDVIKQAPAATDATDQKKRDALKLGLLRDAMEVHRLMAKGGVDITKSADAGVVYNDYFALETDPAKKLAAQITLADIYRLAGDSANAIAAYRVVLQGSPDNPDALAGLGLSLFNSGVVASDKAQMQEGLNYMTRYTEIAPITATDDQATKEFKASVKDAVDYLKNTEKLAPQKPAPKKRGN